MALKTKSKFKIYYEHKSMILNIKCSLKTINYFGTDIPPPTPLPVPEGVTTFAHWRRFVWSNYPNSSVVGKIGAGRTSSGGQVTGDKTKTWVWLGVRFRTAHRNSRFPESSGTAGSWSNPELRVPWVTWNLGSRIQQEHRIPPSYPELWVPWIIRNFVFPKSSVTQVSLIHPELRGPGVTRNSGFSGSLGTTCSSSHPEYLTPGFRISWWVREPGFPFCPGARCSEWFRETGILRVTPGARSPGCLREPGDPGDSVNSESMLTPRTRSSVWFRESVVPGDSGNPEFFLTRETWSFGWLRVR